MDPKALFYKAMNLLREEKQCMHPDQGNCSGNIIKAHTISKSSALKPMAVDGHIYMFDHSDHRTFKSAYNLGYLEPVKVGINKATTFTGFCGKHDNDAFEKIDDPDMSVGLDEAMLLSYRSLAREIYAKKGAIKVFELLKEENAEQNEDISNQLKSNKVGLHDLLEELPEFHEFLSSAECDYSFQVIRFTGTPSFACSGGFFPEFSFNGDLLQDLSDPDMTMQKLWVNLIPRGNNTSELVFCWKSNHNKAKEFVDSFMSLETSKLATALTWLCFEHFENLAISPIWWDSMRAMRRVVLGKRFLNSMDVDIERQANYLEFGTRRFTDWVVTELAEDTA